ncbi:hypothetical protein FEM48_Zijuj01G0305900 [Ziziphus jujuba var. spinosa]|uniref:Uncharacterized protein n=1 Tax=Ziziphus jujuba var. spinosa TaxID=714518 RepID=A0A978W618_ZIZJJ|nr:hypothetical protein FEM48_Zijuj01G0305900 [Ziziphus jujuba var. spinosa]
MKMLLRSSSAPILDSWLPYHKDFSLVTQPFLQLPRTRSVSLTCSFRSHSPIDDDESANKALWEADLTTPPKPKQKNNPISHGCRKQPEIKANEKEDQEVEESTNNEGSGMETTEFPSLQTMLWGGGVGNDGTGGGSGIEGRLDGGDEGWGFNESDGVDMYYHSMIEARFSIEIPEDDAKPEKYHGRAILGSSKSDGIVLSHLADLIWTIYGDAERADTYFQQAIKICNDDCYVAAAYARFLWDDDDADR